MSPRKTKKEAPPSKIVREGFWTSDMPRPESAYLRDAPDAYNRMALVYRYRVTVERIEEPPPVIIARMLDVFRKVDSRSREAIVQEARDAFGVDLNELAKGTKP